MPGFGRYTLVRRVGTGGMAEIWKAKAQGPAGFEKILAIKKVLPHLAEDSEFIEMFIEEAKLVATLVHPNIVQVFDFGQVGKSEFFIAMEYVSGANLAMILKRVAERGSRLPSEVALYIALEVCKGLGYAHAHTDATGVPLAIIHRDVSPQNVLIGYGGEVKITDFGIAKVASALTRTAEGHVRGKLAYMSPEQADTKPLDNRSDLFSLGVVLYELLVGRRLFSGSSGSEIFAKVTSFTVPTEVELPQMPSEVKLILRTTLQPDPAERYQDAMELEHALATALGPDGIVQARHALASIVQRLFEEERKLELTASVPEESEGPTQGVTVVGASAEVSASSGSAVVPVESPPEPATAVSGSGLTLAPSSVKAVPAIKKLPSGPTRSAAERPPEQLKAALTALLFVVSLGAAALVGARFLPPLLSPTTTTTPTPLVLIQPGFTSVSTPTTATTFAPAFTPVRTPRHASATPQPTPATVALAATPGSLTVKANPWVRIYIDNAARSVNGDGDPLTGYRLSPGRHTLRMVNEALHLDTSRSVTIVSGVETRLRVDAHLPADRAVTRE